MEDEHLEKSLNRFRDSVRSFGESRGIIFNDNSNQSRKSEKFKSSLHQKLDPCDPDDYEMLFDQATMDYVKFRRDMIDPITYEEMTPDTAFVIDQMWNCMTGEKIGPDPNGPLYVSPVTILRTIRDNLLNGFWMEIDDCVPMYGEQLGAGENFYVKGRGARPEKYLFRYPFPELYKFKGQNAMIHTTGPKFTNEELERLDNLIEEYWLDDPYVEELDPDSRSLRVLKKYYHAMLWEDPFELELPEPVISTYSRNYDYIGIDHRSYINRIAVDRVKPLVGYVIPRDPDYI